MNEYMYSGAHFLNKRQGLDRIENKNTFSNLYNFSKNSSKLSKLDRLNSSHTAPETDDKGINPLRSDSIKAELHKDPHSEGIRKSNRLKTDESEKLRKMDISFDCVYLEKQKGPQEQKRKMAPAMQNIRALSNNRPGRNASGKDHLNLSRGTDENLADPRRKNIYPRLQNKRTSAQVEKSFTNNFMETTLPVIYVNGVEKFKKEKPSTKNNDPNVEKNEVQTTESPNKNSKKEAIVSKLILPLKKTAAIRNENSKVSKSRAKQEASLSPDHYDNDSYSYTQNFRSSNSLAGTNLAFSPPKDSGKEQNSLNQSFLDGISSSMNAKSHLNNPLSIDHAFEKVKELTNKNNLARYDLLKIQESALELKMRLNARRNHLAKPMKEMNRTNQTVIEELSSYNSLFVMNNEI